MSSRREEAEERFFFQQDKTCNQVRPVFCFRLSKEENPPAKYRAYRQ
jgi:hypothetical protein